MVDEIVNFFNMVVDGVPILEAYSIPSSTVNGLIETADRFLSTVEREIDFVDKIAGIVHLIEPNEGGVPNIGSKAEFKIV